MSRKQGTQMLVSWRIWVGAIKEQCPVKSDDPNECRQAICPCRRLKLHEAYEMWAEKMEPWAKTGSGRIGGMMKIARKFRERE